MSWHTTGTAAVAATGAALSLAGHVALGTLYVATAAGLGSWLYVRHLRLEAARERAARLAPHVRPFAEVIAALRPLRSPMTEMHDRLVLAAAELEKMHAAARAAAAVANPGTAQRRVGGDDAGEL